MCIIQYSNVVLEKGMHNGKRITEPVPVKRSPGAIGAGAASSSVTWSHWSWSGFFVVSWVILTLTYCGTSSAGGEESETFFCHAGAEVNVYGTWEGKDDSAAVEGNGDGIGVEGGA